MLFTFEDTPRSNHLCNISEDDGTDLTNCLEKEPGTSARCAARELTVPGLHSRKGTLQDFQGVVSETR